MTPDMPVEPDQIEGVALPRAQHHLVGHQFAEQTFLNAVHANRLHHAWLLTGPRGIGKATFAFRAAKYLMTQGKSVFPADSERPSLQTDPHAPTVSKISNGSHGQLLHLTRDWDHDRKRFKQDLTVDTIRKTNSFFGSTAAEGGWRIAIVDAADDMNASAANALLKILEEPPKASLFFVICHLPGRLLPTIRSRCRTLAMRPLNKTDLQEAFSTAHPSPNTVDSATLETTLPLAEGSVRRLLTLCDSSGQTQMAHIESFLSSVHKSPSLAHALSDQMARGSGDETYSLFRQQVLNYLHDAAKARAETQALGDAFLFTEAHRSLSQEFRRQEAFNLDRKQMVLSVARTLAGLPTTA